MNTRRVWLALAVLVLAFAPGCGAEWALTVSEPDEEQEPPEPETAAEQSPVADPDMPGIEVSELAPVGTAEEVEDNAGKVIMSDEEWKKKLTEEQYFVTREAGTERAFTGKYWDTKTKGVYQCVACGLPLFGSETKFESGTGWPSFFKPIDEKAVAEKKDMSAGMVRIEALCSRCDSHLGHVFPDGPRPTGLRYCLNSAALDLVPAKDADPERADEEE